MSCARTVWRLNGCTSSSQGRAGSSSLCSKRNPMSKESITKNTHQTSRQSRVSSLFFLETVCNVACSTWLTVLVKSLSHVFLAVSSVSTLRRKTLDTNTSLINQKSKFKSAPDISIDRTDTIPSMDSGVQGTSLRRKSGWSSVSLCLSLFSHKLDKGHSFHLK